MFHQYEASLLKCTKSMARRKIIYVREAVNYSIDVCCFVGFSLPISVTAFQLFLQTSAHYFMQFNWFLAWQQSVNKAVPCQTVNSFPFAHHLWLLLEKQATSSGYWPRQAPEGNLTISISCQNAAGEDAGSHLKAEQGLLYLLLEPWGRRQTLITWCKVELVWNVKAAEGLGGVSSVGWVVLFQFCFFFFIFWSTKGPI